MPERVTPAEAEKRLGVPANVIAQWKRRRRITAVGLIPGPGRGGKVPLYRLAELQPLADAYHERTGRKDTAS